MTFGDFTLDSCAQFLAAAEHRLIPARARSAPACHDQVAGGHAGVWVVHLCHFLPLLLLNFRRFFRLGRVLRTTLPTGKDLIVVHGYQGAEEDADQLRLTDKLLQAVLAEGHVVCIGQPMLIAGDLNADPAVISYLAKGTSAGSVY